MRTIILLAAVLTACGGGVDFDGDGTADAEDCAPEDPFIHPGAAEICDNGGDEDCDELIDQADPDCQGGDDDAGDDDAGDDDVGDDDVGDDDVGDDDAGDDDLGDDDAGDDDLGDDDAGDDDSTVDDDGDGFTADVDCDDGAAHVFPGAPEVVDLAVNDCADRLAGTTVELLVADAAPHMLVGTVDYSSWGDSASLGDLDGDGNGDLCLRGWSDSSSIPTDVAVFLDVEGRIASSGGGLTQSAADVVVSGVDGEGVVDCSHDLDGDGDTELLIGAGRDAETSSGFFIFLGAPAFGAVSALTPADADRSRSGTAVEEVGHCFGVGDLLAEPGIEVAVGRTDSVVGELRDRRIEVWDATLTTVLASATSDGTPYSGFLCPILADLDGGGQDELLVDGDEVATLYLGEQATTGTPGSFVAASTLDPPDAALSVDLTGDGLGELVVGYHYDDFGGDAVGVVNVFYGTPGALAWQVGLPHDPGPDPGRGFQVRGVTADGSFGLSLCPLADVDGDGRAELLVAASGLQWDSSFPGAVHGLRGRPQAEYDAWPTPIVASDLDLRIDGSVDWPRLGLVGPGWDLGWHAPGSGAAGIWVASPDATPGTAPDAGGLVHWPVGP